MNAMVLAAGLGTRMRPVTDTMPKPLVPVAGKPLIAYALDRLAEAGASKAVVNVHHFARQIVDYLEDRPGIETEISDERERLLDSGGGVAWALPSLGPGPFFILNADTFWVDDAGESPSSLVRLAKGFDAERMDMLMLLADPARATGHTGAGDFTMDGEGRLRRHAADADDPLIYAGALVTHPECFSAIPEGPFSLNLLFDRAIAADRLFGLRLNGHWITVGTPPAIGEAERALTAREGGAGGQAG